MSKAGRPEIPPMELCQGRVDAAWVTAEAAVIPALGPVDQWHACLMQGCLLPSWIMEGVDTEAVDNFVYRLFGMSLVVLSMRMQCEQDTAEGEQVGLLFPDMPQPGRGKSYPGGAASGPPLAAPGSATAHASTRSATGWKWDSQLAVNLLTWADGLKSPPPPPVGYALVQATVGVGTVLPPPPLCKLPPLETPPPPGRPSLPCVSS